MKIALAHHWVMSYRGGERVLEQIAGLFRDAPICTLAHDRSVRVPGLVDREIRASFLQHLPQISRLYKHLLPVHPFAISRMSLPVGTDVLLSSDASLIKGIPLEESTKHVCYCHSPPRYLWELTSEYKNASLSTRLLLDRFLPKLKQFDFDAAQRVDHFIANSRFVATRIKRYYGRECDVVYPPVAVEAFCASRPRKDNYLVLSELASYKRIDLAIEAFANTNRRLIVIGDGPERSQLEKMATKNIEFLGRQPFDVVKEHLETARAFIFPGIEDFGIAPVEAQASGCPIIAFGCGGALETVVDGKTGLFFHAQTANAVRAAIEEFETMSIRSSDCAENASQFSSGRFQSEYLECLSAYTNGAIRDLATEKRIPVCN